MKIKCQFMELGKPLFLAGVNYGEKLKEKSGKGTLEILWDEDTKCAKVTDQRGCYTFITESWVFTFEPVQENRVVVPINKSHDIVSGISRAQVSAPAGIITAQVTTPQDKANRKAGRPPKFQGEEVKE